MTQKWELVTLDKLGRISKGIQKHKPNHDKKLFCFGKVPLIGCKEVSDSRLTVLKSNRNYNFYGLLQSKLFPKNTVCVVETGSLVTDSALLKFEACLSSDLYGFIPFSKISTPTFIKYCLDAPKNKRKLKNLASLYITQPHLTLSKLFQVKFPKPPLEIQQKIGEILSRYDLILDNHERQIELLKNLKASLFKEWFIKLRFPDYEKYSSENGIPEGWRKIRFGDLTEIQIGKKPASHSELLDGLGKYPFFTCSTKTKNSYTFSYDFPSLLVSAGGAITVSFMMGNLKLAPTFLFRN
ncbi:restriction endonuclease subunit S [Mycoplasma suis]|uniref:Type I restriction-modification system specificity subunit n=1 Tax=Mycoplasma suis (strain Illinois) TaxID=768700 RepID=F0QQQ1_MYCSL|nr:restriction endonuclease subunit S [Mycoplasma suis]ADX97821.1 type I restriction-modification system specificity subunit [Mycoplasma suis str. Illinois]